MRKLAAVVAVLAFPTLAAAQEGKIHFERASFTGGTIAATRGANLAPAIGAGTGYTCGAGWDCSVAGTLNKNADGVGTVVPNPAITAVVDSTYEVTITLGAVTVGNGATYTFGGTAGTVALTAATTYTHYIKAATTASLIITPTPTGTRFTITDVQVELLTAGTGDVTVEGDLITRQSNYAALGVCGSATASPSYTFSALPFAGVGTRGTGTLCIQAQGNNEIEFWSNAAKLWVIPGSGALQPNVTDAYAIGGSTKRVTDISLSTTVTAAGTTGAQTINKVQGIVNFAAAASSLVVTNSTAAAASLIFVAPQANDATCKTFTVTRAAGSFTINAEAACTAETPVAFWVRN